MFYTITSSIANDMTTREQGLCRFTIGLTSNLHKKQSLNNQSNNQETPLNLITHKKFLLALIFALPNSYLNKVIKVGVSQTGGRTRAGICEKGARRCEF
jgi:hypothetical protein